VAWIVARHCDAVERFGASRIAAQRNRYSPPVRIARSGTEVRMAGAQPAIGQQSHGTSSTRHCREDAIYVPLVVHEPILATSEARDKRQCWDLIRQGFDVLVGARLVLTRVSADDPERVRVLVHAALPEADDGLLLAVGVHLGYTNAVAGRPLVHEIREVRL